MNHVVIKNLRKVFSSKGCSAVNAVNGVDLEIPHGQFLSIMGPSGSGKTTLLHLMAGLAKPTEGEVVIDGTVLASLSDRQLTLFRRRNIGIIFQSFNLMPTLTAEENIMLPVLAGYHEVDRKRLNEAIDTLMERLQLTERRGHYPDTLSGGEQQRVAIARALLVDFATERQGGLLLADEPTGNLDSVNGETLCRLLKDLCRESGHTMVVVTHEPSVAKWSDRVVTLTDGKIVRDCPPNEL